MKPSVQDQLDWIRHEIGNRVELDDFARTYIELFSCVVHGDAVQRSKCLQLYAKYDPEACADWKHQNGKIMSMESAVPPFERSQFLRVWNPYQPQLCNQCACHVPTSFTRRLCVDCSPPGRDLRKMANLEVAEYLWIYGDTVTVPSVTTDPAWKKARRS